ncbi:DNA internalization-related competence protein ComEC/Rec2 [Kibdelosporangium philippinense]|uniref:DNA internalization-related competence protein ComEC/Rec2 n=1 Tax=Kibdelosporangium philippinense TaxID=211113 RepID=A0ABS8ZV03_9PSEU|nr:DNA internalization-related competence protein ComEC/Rec2 [Kibdelosporangium philippinense]MCE7011570.1 DNA internalization-related competence protein ComEC/Rec2 [Kibdelosporangium philippinense]
MSLLNRSMLDPLKMRDWRLVPAAIAVWLAALLGLLVSWWCTVVIGVLAGSAGALVLWKRWPALGLRGDGRGRWLRRGMGWSLLVCGAVSIVPTSWRLKDWEQDPLRFYADRGEAAHLTVVLSDRPQPIFSAGFGGQQAGARLASASAEVKEAKVDGQSIPSTGAVVLLVPMAGWSSLLPGQQLRADGTLAPGDSAVAVLRVRGPPTDVTPAPVWQRVAEEMRAGLRQAAGVLSPESAGLLPALVVGDTTMLPQRVVEEFRAAGMAHLLAVSGANLAIVGVATLLLLRLMRLGPRLCATGAGLTLVGFVVLAGPEPSVLRAAVMGGVGLLALVIGRERAALPALATSVIVLVLHDPMMATSIGFALSVLATGALVLLATRWSRSMADRGVPRMLAEAVAVPAAAHLATAPVVAGMSGQISLVAVGANLLASAVVAPATVLGLLAALAAGLFPWLAEFFVWLAGPELYWMIQVGRHAAAIPGAVLDWPTGWWGGMLLAVVLTVGVLLLRHRRLRVLAAAMVVGFAVVLVPIRVVAPGWPPSGWSSVACDVGQGDAVVLATDEPGRAVLVDTGPDPGAIAGCLNRLGVSRIPLVILTHLHADHVGGLPAVLGGNAIGAVAVGSGRLPAWAWRQVQSEAERSQVPVLWLTAGQRLNWPGLTIEVLGPRYADTTQEGEATGTEINNGSLVLRATTGSGRVLLTGDVELAAQADLLDTRVDLRADVLKVPHHGSRYIVPEFIDAVRPRVAMISVGAANRYGHPNPGTLRRLVAGGAMVLRTDQDGDVAVVGDLTVVRRRDPRGPPK